MANQKKLRHSSTFSKALVWITIILIAVYALTGNEDVLGVALLIIFALLLYVVVRILIKAFMASSSSWSMLISEIKENRAAKKTISTEKESVDEESQTEERKRLATEAVRQYYQTHPRLWQPRQITIHKHTNTDVTENVSTKFDFTDIPYVINPEGNSIPPKYLLNGSNEEKAKQDILALNGFLDIARDRAPGFPIVQISEDMLLFDPPTDPMEPFVFCCLQTNVFTKKTNKVSKYPISLHFAETSHAPYRIRGSIDYFADGEVGKAQIFGWCKDEGFELYCKTNIYDFLELHKIVYNGNTVYKSELEDVQISSPDEYKSTPKHQPKTETKIITHYEEETVYCTLSDSEIEDIQSIIEFIFRQNSIPSEVLGYSIKQEYTEFDITVPDGMRLQKLLSYRDEIGNCIPKFTIDMQPEYERGVVVIRVKHKSQQTMVPHEEVVEMPIYEGRS